MAQSAVAHEAVRALRLEIARIEGRPGLLPAPSAPHATGGAVLRRDGRIATMEEAVATGAKNFDAALGGGLVPGALLEVAAPDARAAGPASGFALILAGLFLARPATEAPALLWIGTDALFNEAGLPYLRGAQSLLGTAPRLFLAHARRPGEALWIAEEAAGAAGLGAVLVEARNEKLDLAATRRLHLRAQKARRPVILLRHGPEPQPTAACLRLVVGPARAAPRRILGRPLSGTIGQPAFTVAVAKSRSGPPLSFTLDWNAHEHRFAEREPEDSRAVVSSPRRGADQAPAARAVLAFKPGPGAPAAGLQQSREEPAGARRAGRGG